MSLFIYKFELQTGFLFHCTSLCIGLVQSLPFPLVCNPRSQHWNITGLKNGWIDYMFVYISLKWYLKLFWWNMNLQSSVVFFGVLVWDEISQKCPNSITTHHLVSNIVCLRLCWDVRIYNSIIYCCWNFPEVSAIIPCASMFTIGEYKPLCIAFE